MMRDENDPPLFDMDAVEEEPLKLTINPPDNPAELEWKPAPGTYTGEHITVSSGTYTFFPNMISHGAAGGVNWNSVTGPGYGGVGGSTIVGGTVWSAGGEGSVNFPVTPGTSYTPTVSYTVPPEPAQIESVEMTVKMKDGKVIKWSAKAPASVQVENQKDSYHPFGSSLDVGVVHDLYSLGVLSQPAGVSITIKGGLPYAIEVQTSKEDSAPPATFAEFVKNMPVQKGTPLLDSSKETP